MEMYANTTANVHSAAPTDQHFNCFWKYSWMGTSLRLATGWRQLAPYIQECLLKGSSSGSCKMSMATDKPQLGKANMTSQTKDVMEQAPTNRGADALSHRAREAKVAIRTATVYPSLADYCVGFWRGYTRAAIYHAENAPRNRSCEHNLSDHHIHIECGQRPSPRDGQRSASKQMVGSLSYSYTVRDGNACLSPSLSYQLSCNLDRKSWVA